MNFTEPHGWPEARWVCTFNPFLKKRVFCFGPDGSFVPDDEDRVGGVRIYPVTGCRPLLTFRKLRALLGFRP